VVVNNDGIFFNLTLRAIFKSDTPCYIHFPPGRAVEPLICEPPHARHIQDGDRVYAAAKWNERNPGAFTGSGSPSNKHPTAV